MSFVASIRRGVDLNKSLFVAGLKKRAAATFFVATMLAPSVSLGQPAGWVPADPPKYLMLIDGFTCGVQSVVYGYPSVQAAFEASLPFALSCALGQGGEGTVIPPMQLGFLQWEYYVVISDISAVIVTINGYCPGVDGGIVGPIFDDWRTNKTHIACGFVPPDTHLLSKEMGEPERCVGNPCNPVNGNKFAKEVDYVGPGRFPLEITRYYNSLLPSTGSTGSSWMTSYDRRVIRETTIADTRVIFADGKTVQFTGSGPVFSGPPDVPLTLVQTSSGWTLTGFDDDRVEQYDLEGRLVSITSREGTTQTLTYYQSGLSAGLLQAVSDAWGRTLTFAYSGKAVATITDPSGGVYRYAYDGIGNLASVTFPGGAVRQYSYQSPKNGSLDTFYQNRLTGVTDENGNAFAAWQYDSSARAALSQHAGGAEQVTLAYSSFFADDTTIVNVTQSVDEGSTATRTYTATPVMGIRRPTTITGAPCPACGPPSITYDVNGNVASRTDWNGNRTNYTYDLTRNLENSRTEGLTADGNSTAQTRTITTRWHDTLHLPVQISEPLRVTTYVYNGDAGASCGMLADGVTLVPGVLCLKTARPTTDATGAAGLGATVTGTPRTWVYTYNANGLVSTVDGPRTDVADLTTYTYYSDNDSDLGKRGNLATITNAVGQTTAVTAYNAHGQPTTIVDPNGLAITLAYDPRMRLVSRTVGGETTSYDYDGVGQLLKVTLPDGSFLAYTYDAAHRLTGMSDAMGNHIAYTLDAMGNRKQEQVFDPANTLVRTRSRVYDNLNHLVQELGAQSQTTSYGYDNQGNVTSITDPLNHVTVNQYDALNRLVQVTDPGQGVTQYGYDGLDQLASVTDPRNLVTSYGYDGLSNLNSQASPDTGTSTNTYDAAGNLLTHADAKGQVTIYTYDALNRVASTTFNDGTRQSYTYDVGPNAFGRLTQIVEADANQTVISQIVYAYDVHGRVLSETRTIAGINYATAYQYDAAGRLSGITYPSGRTVAYTFDTLGRVSEVDSAPAGGTAQPIASGIAYQPFGDVNSFTFGNGQTYARGYDQDGRIASYSLITQTFAVGYDAASRISFIADAANPSNAVTYGYDALDRLTSAVTPSTPFAYSYDAVGNRLSKTVGSSTDTYTYNTTSNRLSSITTQAGLARSVNFDANGSTVNDGINQYAYDSRRRMVQSIGALGSTTYQVNALGQRIRKTNVLEDRVYHYDTRGRLIAETDPGGTLLREYLYLNDIPLAVIQ